MRTLYLTIPKLMKLTKHYFCSMQSTDFITEPCYNTILIQVLFIDPKKYFLYYMLVILVYSTKLYNVWCSHLGDCCIRKLFLLHSRNCMLCHLRCDYHFVSFILWGEDSTVKWLPPGWYVLSILPHPIQWDFHLYHTHMVLYLCLSSTSTVVQTLMLWGLDMLLKERVDSEN